MPLREYKCLECGGKIEQIHSSKSILGSGRFAGLDAPTVIATIVWECVCGDVSGEVEEVIRPAAIRFKGPGFHLTDNVRPNSWKGTTDARFRMRKEIRDAYDNGELKPGENPFNSSPAKPKELQLDDTYGNGAEKPITEAMKNLGDAHEAEVKLPGDKTVMIARKDKTHFSVGEAKANVKV